MTYLCAMTPAQNEKACYFAGRLRQRLPHGLKQVLLFGSQARGDATEASDYDFAVIVKAADSNAVRAVR